MCMPTHLVWMNPRDLTHDRRACQQPTPTRSRTHSCRLLDAVLIHQLWLLHDSVCLLLLLLLLLLVLLILLLLLLQQLLLLARAATS